MSQLAWGFISKSNGLFVFVLLGAFWVLEVVPGGRLWEMPPAATGAGHAALPSSHVMPHGAVLGRTRPQGALRRHATAGHPALQLPAVRSWGGVLGTPSKQGGGFLNWPGKGQENEKEMVMIIWYVQPTLLALEVARPARVGVGTARRRGRIREGDGQEPVGTLSPQSLWPERGAHSVPPPPCTGPIALPSPFPIITSFCRS